MKKLTRTNHIGYKWYSKILLLLFVLSIGSKSFAQCLVNSLDIKTARAANSLAVLAPTVNDPYWDIVGRDAVWGGATGLPIDALVVVAPNWPFPTANGWISDTQPHANGIILPALGAGVTGYDMTFRRSFRLCEASDVTFTLDMLSDNLIHSVIVDGNPVTLTGIPQPFALTNINTYLHVNFTLALGIGAHNLDIVVRQVDRNNPTTEVNAVGLNVLGTITTGINKVIVNDMNAACNNYACPNCEDKCYWKVEGNRILNGNNIFGTLTNDDVQIQTNSIDRGLITKGGLLGWNLTTANPPTALWDVDCNGFNSQASGLSDIRFRSLETTTNAEFKTLVIDPSTGYVYNSNVSPGGGTAGWDLLGNTITSGNFLGSLNDKDVKIHTYAGSSTSPTNLRMIIKGSTNGSATDPLGGFVGVNTSSPTARWHVNCSSGNATTSGISDIRFENLEPSPAGVATYALGIDANGYVFNTNTTINPNNKWDLSGNTISSSDFMGTINNEDIRFNTYTSGSSPFSNSQRMVIKGNSPGVQNDPMGGFVGINTPAPTARLHVNCNSGNSDATANSDVRFEALEVKSDHLKLLGIDANGYVYNTNKTLPLGTPWNLGGNSVTSNQVFGTLSPFDVQIQTNGIQRGVFEQDGDLGWHLAPGNPATTNLHVDAANPADPTVPSGIRFENLQSNNGYVMVIDDQGYVYNSNVKITDLGGGGDVGLMRHKIDDLEKQVNELKGIIANSKSDATASTNGNELYQNNPNPFGTETSIGFNIVKMQETAFIAIYDLNGRELYRYNVTAKGKGAVSVSGDKLVPGQYLYSLIVDGHEEATKKMVVSK